MESNNNGGETLTRRERERAAHRQEIMDAAVRVFARRGFGSATLDEVAKEAEFSKGTLYLHFTSKEDILYNIIYEMGEYFKNIHRNVLCGKRSFREELTDLFITMAEYAFTHSDWNKVVMTQFADDYCILSDGGKEKFRQRHEEILNIIRERTRKAYEDGELRDISIEGITRIIHGSIGGMSISHWEMDSFENTKKAVALFIEVLFGGIAREKEKCA